MCVQTNRGNGNAKNSFGNTCTTVRDNPVLEQQQRIAHAIDEFIQVVPPTIHRLFTRKLGAGEQGVLNLALEMHPDFLLLDDKKARHEAKELDLIPVFTVDILKGAEHQQYIASFISPIY